MTRPPRTLEKCKEPDIVSPTVGIILFALPYEALAGAALIVHLVWILWVVLGALVTRHRPLLAGLHVISLIYGVVIEVAPWPCPLTLAERWLQNKANITPYAESFLVHYLDKLVYPDVSQESLVWWAVAVSLFNLGIYAWRFWRSR
jgi:hypothetical protein